MKPVKKTSRNISEVRRFNEAIENSCQTLLQDASTKVMRLFVGHGGSYTGGSDKVAQGHSDPLTAVPSVTPLPYIPSVGSPHKEQ